MLTRQTLLLFIGLLVVICCSASAETFNYTTYGNHTEFYVNSSSALTNYQVNVILSNATGFTSTGLYYTNGTTRSDWKDVAWTDDSNNLLGFWMETNTTTAANSTWWIKVPSISDANTTTIKLHYGNASKTESYENGYNTFLVFDSFEGTSLNTTAWVGDNSSTYANVSGGILTFSTTTTSTDTRVLGSKISLNTDTDSVRMRSYGYIPSTTSLGSQIGLSKDSAGGRAVFTTWNTAYSSVLTASQGWGSNDIYTNTYHVFEVDYEPSVHTHFYVDGSSVTQHTCNSPEDESLWITSYTLTPGTSGKTFVDWIFASKYVSNEPFLTFGSQEYLEVPPVATFTANITSSTYPIPVQFNDTSLYIPTAWNWSFTNITPGNNTQVWFSTDQNPVQGFGYGYWDIKLNSSNSYGYNISTQVTFINITPAPLVANFTCSPVSGTNATMITCTDTSDPGDYSIDSWSWDFEDSITNTTQNPEFHYTHNGVYDVNLTIYNSTYGYSSLVKSSYITISDSGGYSGWNRQDILMDQIFTLTMNIKDASTHGGISGATVITSEGGNTTTDAFGVATFSVNYSVVLVSAGKSGYFSNSRSYVMDRDRNETIYLTVSPYANGSASSSTNWAATHYVEFRVRSWTGAPVENVNITATYVEASNPLEWIYSWAGVPTNVSVQNTTLFGHTGDDGVVTFLMVPVVQYEITAYKSGEVDESMTVYPQDEYYNIWVGGGVNGSVMYASGYNELDVIKFSTNGTELNSTHGRIHVEYVDLLSQTSSATVLINQSVSSGNTTTETTVASYTSTAAGNFTHDFDLAGTRDESYIVRMRSTGTTFANVSRDYGVTFPPGPITLGIPEPLLVYAGMFALIFIALCFTRTLPGPAAIVIMFFAWIFYFMRWWNNMAPEWVVVTALTFFSILAVIFNVMIRSKKRNFES